LGCRNRDFSAIGLSLAPEPQNPAAANVPQDPADRNPLDPELARILDAWPTLPPAIRGAMLALADSGR
jgi:hypothetical protein